VHKEEKDNQDGWVRMDCQARMEYEDREENRVYRDPLAQLDYPALRVNLVKWGEWLRCLAPLVLKARLEESAQWELMVRRVLTEKWAKRVHLDRLETKESLEEKVAKGKTE
jgi:hypothetical protein